jgi:hypothetical protein
MSNVALTTAARNSIVPNDRVVYAAHWQGCLETPSAELAPFAPDFEGYADESPEANPTAEDFEWLSANPTPFEPTDADWDDYHRHCEDFERQNALRRMEDYEYEALMRFGE